jgi:hypothetical protein
MDAALPIEVQQRLLRRQIAPLLDGVARGGAVHAEV